MARLKVKYNEEIAPALMKKFQYKSVMQIPQIAKVIVEGVNVATCHVKARKQNDVSGIVKREIPIRVDKVQLYCSNCKKGVRVGFKTDGDKKVRVCKKCGKEL